MRRGKVLRIGGGERRYTSRYRNRRRACGGFGGERAARGGCGGHGRLAFRSRCRVAASAAASIFRSSYSAAHFVTVISFLV